jgi:hypothetical protein
MRESRMSGFVRGARSNTCPYRDPYLPVPLSPAEPESYTHAAYCLRGYGYLSWTCHCVSASGWRSGKRGRFFRFADRGAPRYQTIL